MIVTSVNYQLTALITHPSATCSNITTYAVHVVLVLIAMDNCMRVCMIVGYVEHV